ncbi:hypothetical protein MRX96_001378 [Rhipicephalus microplus]
MFVASAEGTLGDASPRNRYRGDVSLTSRRSTRDLYSRRLYTTRAQAGLFTGRPEKYCVAHARRRTTVPRGAAKGRSLLTPTSGHSARQRSREKPCRFDIFRLPAFSKVRSS